MSSVHNMQRRWNPKARQAFGVLAVLWLNLLFQPCAMALGADPHQDCPDCPPAHSQHDGHEMAPADMADMADSGMPCAGSAADCGVVDELNYDGRNTQLKVKDAPLDSPLMVSAFANPAAHIKPARHAYQRPAQRPPPGPSQTLNKLYCVYLK